MFVRARQKLGEILSAFEFFDQQALDLTLKHLEGVRNPLPDTQTPFYLVVETSGSNEAHDSEKLQVGARHSPIVTSKGMQHWLQMHRTPFKESLSLSARACHPTGHAPPWECSMLAVCLSFGPLAAVAGVPLLQITAQARTGTAALNKRLLCEDVGGCPGLSGGGDGGGHGA